MLGVRDYPVNDDSTAIYSDRLRRCPVMVGVNLPLPTDLLTRRLWNFSLLDRMAVELEYFGSRIPNDFQTVETERLPLHGQRAGGRDYGADDWKWSVYLQKQLNEVFSVRAQAASDHLRINTNNKTDWDREENLRSPGDWYWMAKVQYEF